MPAALAAGMDCQTFWQSNPKRIKQFLAARKQLDAVDLEAWATGYYVARAFGGKFPKKPELLKQTETEEEALSTENYVSRWIKWAQIQQARLIDKQVEEARAEDE